MLFRSVKIAKDNGVLVYYGGGPVAVSEVTEARKQGIPCELYLEWEPDPNKVAARNVKNPAYDATPLRTFAGKGIAPEI